MNDFGRWVNDLAKEMQERHKKEGKEQPSNALDDVNVGIAKYAAEDDISWNPYGIDLEELKNDIARQDTDCDSIWKDPSDA